MTAVRAASAHSSAAIGQSIGGGPGSDGTLVAVAAALSEG